VSLPPSVDLQTYYAPAQGLTGAALANALHQIIDDHTVIDNGNIGEIMKVIDEAANDDTAVRLLYSNANLPKSSFNIGGGWNREHTWPRSDGVGDDGPDYSDLHHLFPCKETVNSLRGNLPFDESTNLESDPFAPESFKDGDTWEPFDRDKGVVARALLYMMVRYDGADSLTSDLILGDSTGAVGIHGVLSTLLAWHRAHPPTDYERTRNEAIYAGVAVGPTTYRQGNRNPFIDFPQFADAIFGTAGQYNFSRWQLDRFNFNDLGDPTISGEDADSDGDGTDNYGEYLQNGDPAAGDDRFLEVVRNGNQLTLIFHRPKGAPEAPVLESSTTLLGGSWSDVAGWQTATTVTDLGNYERLTYLTTINPLAEKRRFWRVIYE
jgi:endonuclease I